MRLVTAYVGVGLTLKSYIYMIREIDTALVKWIGPILLFALIYIYIYLECKIIAIFIVKI